jgi:hypothetical protein
LSDKKISGVLKRAILTTKNERIFKLNLMNYPMANSRIEAQKLIQLRFGINIPILKPKLRIFDCNKSK